MNKYRSLWEPGGDTAFTNGHHYVYANEINPNTPIWWATKIYDVLYERLFRFNF